MATTAPTRVFKLVLVGDAATGKSALLRACIDHAQTEYKPTIGVEVRPLYIRVHSPAAQTTYWVEFDVWDTAGVERLGGLRDGYYIGAHAAFVVARASEPTLGPVRSRITRIKRVSPEALVSVVLTRRDPREETKVTALERGTLRDVVGCHAVCLSTESVYEPFLNLARLLTGDKSLTRLDAPVVLSQIPRA
jgi:GTP-binding nuclear protein Ran